MGRWLPISDRGSRRLAYALVLSIVLVGAAAAYAEGFSLAVTTGGASGLTEKKGHCMARLTLRAPKLHTIFVYDTEVSRETISKITDQVPPDMAAWQSGPRGSTAVRFAEHRRIDGTA